MFFAPIIRHIHIINGAGLFLFFTVFLYQKHNGHPCLNSKYIMGGSGNFWVRPYITVRIYDISIVKFILHTFSKAVKGPAVNKTPIRNKGNNAIFIQSVKSPAVKTGIHIIHLSFLGGAVLYECVLYSLVNGRVFPVFIIVVFIGLVCIIRRVTNHHAYFFSVLVHNPL